MVNNLWPTRTLAEVCGGKGAYGLTASGNANRVGPKFLRTTDMIDGSIDWSAVPYCEVDDVTARKNEVRHGDLVISRTGANAGATAYVSEPPEGAVFAGYLVRFRADPKQADPRFLGFVLKSELWRSYVQNTRTGSAQPQLNAVLMGQFQFPVPPLAEQCRIAGVLGALDELIEVNRKLAIDCSDLAESLWIEATSTSHSEMALADCANVILGGTPSRKEPGFWDGQVPWLNSGEANEFRVTKPSERITDLGYSKSSTKMMPVGATIVAITGATLGQISRLEISACGNQSLVGVWSDSPAMNDFIFFGIRNRIEVLMQSATGGAQQHVNKANVEELRLPWLPDAQIQAWHVAAQPLMKATAELLFEAEMLMTTRDELLPLLMSGRIRVGEDFAA